MKKIIVCALLSICSFVSQAQTREVADKIIAKIDNQIILYSELEQILQANSERLKDTKESRCQILQSLVVNKVLVAKAQIDSIIVEEDYAAERFADKWQEITQGRTDEELKTVLRIDHIELFKSELRSQLYEQLTTQKMREHITKGIKITPSEVRKFFARIPKDSLQAVATEMEVSQIIKTPPLKKEEKERIKNRMEEIYKRITQEKQSFEEMAKIYGEDGTKESGGDLDWQKRGSLVPEFEAVAYKMKVGEISKPIETRFGYHIIKLINRRGDEIHAKHILMMPDWEQVDITEGERFLDSLARNIRADSISFEKAALLYSDDKGPGSMYTAHNGGRIPSNSDEGSYSISIREMDSFIGDLLDEMNVGDVSKPHIFRTPDNKKALRIIYYKAKHPAHIPSFVVDYPKIQKLALAEKQNKALMEWLQKAKNQVYIEFEPEYNDCNILNTNKP